MQYVEKNDEYFIRLAKDNYGMEVRDNSEDELLRLGQYIDAYGLPCQEESCDCNLEMENL